MPCTMHTRLFAAFLVLFACIILIPAATLQASAWTPTTVIFDWDTAASDSGDTVSEIIDGVTATVSSDTGIDLSSLTGYGASGNYVISASGSSSSTVTFSEPLDVISITAVNTGSEAANWTFTPTGVSTNSVSTSVGNAEAATVYVNWAEVISFTVTSDNVHSNFGFDIIVTDTEDVTSPALVGAVRNSDTQITVELSEECQNIIKSNDGGFTVANTETADTYAVSATAQGSDASHVVLTVSDMAAAGAAGVTVTYTLGGNGTIVDIAGNALTTDATGVTIDAWDTTAPVITGAVRNSNTQITVTLSEECQGLDNVNSNGGFTVKNVLTSKTYTVSKTEASPDGKQVILTVADISKACGAGVTITYTAGGTGLVTDLAGHTMATDTTGVTIPAWADWSDLPSVVSIVRYSPSNETISATSMACFRVTFSEAVYNIKVQCFELVISGSACAQFNCIISGIYSDTVYYIYVENLTGDGLVRIDLIENSGITNAHGAPVSGYTEGESYSVDSIAPALTGAQRDSDTQLILELSEDCLNLNNLNNDDFIVRNNIVSWTTYEVLQIAQGTDARHIVLTLSVAEMQQAGGAGVTVVYTAGGNGQITDIAGNSMAANSSAVIPSWSDFIDVPGVNIARFYPTEELISSRSRIAFLVSYINIPGAPSADDVEVILHTTGTASVSNTTTVGLPVSYDSTQYNYFNVSGDGTIWLEYRSKGYTSNHGAPLAESTIGESYTVDSTPPVILGAVCDSDTQITLELSEDCRNLLKNNDGGFTVTKTGSSDTYAVSATAQGADESHIILTVADMAAAQNTGVTVTYTASGNGDIRDIPYNAMATDSVGVTVDPWNVAPYVVDIVRYDPLDAVTDSYYVVFKIIFSEFIDYSTLKSSHFKLVTEGKAASTTIAFTYSHQNPYCTYTVLTNNRDGTMRLDMKDDTGVTDLYGMPIAGGFTSGEVYTLDYNGPVMTGAVRNSNTQITVELSEDSLSLTQSNNGGFTVTKTGGTETYAVSSIAQGADASHVVLTVADMLTAATTGVTVTYDKNNNGNIMDGYNHAMRTDTTGVPIDLWNAAPAVESITRYFPAQEETNKDIVYYLISFSERISGLDITDLTLTKTGTANGTITDLSVSTLESYTVKIENITGTGTLRLDLNDSGTGIMDYDSGPINSGYDTGAVFSIDRDAPVITGVNRDSDTQITVTLSENCKYLDRAGDGGFTVTKTGTSTAYPVSATAKGSDDATVILTVADIASAGSTGITITYTQGTNGIIADLFDNHLQTDTTGWQCTAWDLQGPTILSAVRDSDTQITLTMSENCLNVNNNNSGGFTVTKTGTNETFEVISTATGSIILTVEDMSSARGTGVTVTYTAGGNGAVTDMAGNYMVTDTGGTSVSAWYEPNPDTGDDARTALWLFLFTASGLTALVCIAIPWRWRMRNMK